MVFPFIMCSATTVSSCAAVRDVEGQRMHGKLSVGETKPHATRSAREGEGAAWSAKKGLVVLCQLDE